MHGHQHSNLGFAQVEQEPEFRIISLRRAIGAPPCSLAHCAGLLLRSIALKLSARVVERPSSVLPPRRSDISITLAITVLTYVATAQPSIPLACCERSLSLHGTFFHGRRGKAEKVIVTHFTAVCVQTSLSNIHLEVVNGGSRPFTRRANSNLSYRFQGYLLAYDKLGHTLATNF